MEVHTEFAAVASRIKAFIARRETGGPEFNRLALDLFALQTTHIPIYRALCERRGATPQSVTTWEEIPPMPTEAFKEFEVTSLAPQERTSVFYSSGTTAQNRSRHFHSAESLAVYEDSLLAWFEHCFLAEKLKMALVSLTPSKDAAPNSSLVHMFDALGRIVKWNSVSFFGRVAHDSGWEVESEAAGRFLREASGAVALVGTAYNFVHLAETLKMRPIKLPPGSRVLETGGYKGRSRELSKPELHRLIQRSLGVHSTRIVSEYGMGELSSQAYDRVAGKEAGVLHFPPWARARIISPENGREAAEGETGLLQVYDLANIRSVLAVQTSDVAQRRGEGFVLMGRAAMAEARGCSLMSV